MHVEIGSLHFLCGNLLRLASPAAKQFQLLVGEEPQKNWVLWASLFNYRIQGRDPLLATVTN